MVDKRESEIKKMKESAKRVKDMFLKTDPDLEDMISQYGYSQYLNKIKILCLYMDYYEAEIITIESRIMGLLEAYVFLEENSETGVTLKGNKMNSSIRINPLILSEINNAILLKIDRELNKLNEDKNIVDRINAKNKDTITPQELLKFFQDEQIVDDKIVINEDYCIKIMHTGLLGIGLLDGYKKNQKGTTNITSKEYAFMYDLLMLTLYKKKDKTKTNKMKADYIKYAIEKKKKKPTNNMIKVGKKSG